MTTHLNDQGFLLNRPVIALTHVEAARRLKAAMADRLVLHTRELERQVSQWLAETAHLTLVEQLAAVADQLAALHQQPQPGAGPQ